jgi:hypothetical protein
VPQTTAAALSLASLSLGSSPPNNPHCTNQALDPLASSTIPIPIAGDGTSRSVPNGLSLITALPVQTNGSGGKSGRRRGATFTCESCSKARHPPHNLPCLNLTTFHLGLPSSIVSHQASVGAFAPLAGGVQVRLKQASASAAFGGMRSLLFDLLTASYSIYVE